ncbi:YybH family protein [Sphingomonas sp.]|uniref:YybH family protein n=1 Tax=Sphingomonas sp. TaxID=28214 RepID=UPI003CC5B1AE
MTELVRCTAAANAAWMNGDARGYAELNSHAEDFTIMGPFGGAPTRGFDAWNARAPAVARSFRSGVSELDVIASYASGDLVVLVTIERQRGEIGGVADRDWTLRVTQVYRREGGAWRVVHRHADPLVHLRDMADTAALASGGLPPPT